MKSMTGFGNAELHNDDFDIEIEIKSVNSKYFDWKMSSPRELLVFENQIKEIVAKYIRRGKADLRINFYDKRVPDYQLDENKLKAFAELLKHAKEIIGDETPLDLETIISQPNVLTFHSPAYDESFLQILLETAEQAVKKHQLMAMQEGQKMKEFFDESFLKIKESVLFIERSVPEFQTKCFENAKDNIEQLLKESLNEDLEKRLMLELALYFDKNDITEEIIRIKSHLDKFEERLKGDGIDAGKSLNFIFQEMQREINTISAKYNETTAFEHILRIKEEIEKCREQIQNVE